MGLAREFCLSAGQLGRGRKTRLGHGPPRVVDGAPGRHLIGTLLPPRDVRDVLMIRRRGK